MQFYATDEDIAAWLRQALLPEYRPYSLVGFDRTERRGRVYQWSPFECPIGDFVGCRQGPHGPRQKWFVRSHRLTPVLPADDVADEREWTVNGLIDLQHGGRHGDRQTASSIGIAATVRNDTTGQQIRHEGYLVVFASLKRIVQSDARHPIIRTFPDGRRFLDRSLAPMTDNARSLALEQPYFFDIEPAD